MDSEEFKQLILRKTDLPEDFDYNVKVFPCFGMSWDRRNNVWIIKLDGKRMLEISQEDFPVVTDFRSYEFTNHILGVLRSSGIDGLRQHIEELKCSK